MLKTTRLFAMKLALRYADLMRAGLFQSARLASAYQLRSGVSAAGCFFQNSRNVRRAMIRIRRIYHDPEMGATLCGRAADELEAAGGEVALHLGRGLSDVAISRLRRLTIG